MIYGNLDEQDLLKLLKKLQKQIKVLEKQNQELSVKYVQLEKSIQHLTKKTDINQISRDLASQIGF